MWTQKPLHITLKIAKLQTFKIYTYIFDYKCADYVSIAACLHFFYNIWM